MTLRHALIAALTGILSVLPVLYLRLIWPAAPELVAMHYNAHGVADHFVSRHELWGIAWWPLVAFVALTFFPQVRPGQSLFWHSPRQRQLRAVIVGALAVIAITWIHAGIEAGKELEATTTHPLAPTRRMFY